MLLAPDTWTGNIFIGGAWRPGSAGTAKIVEPATGESLGDIGIADASDVARASTIATKAQHSWAALPHIERAAVLRRAGQLFSANADEIAGWNIREVGAIPAMAGFSVHTAEQECYEAAALPGRPTGELLPSEQSRLSFARRVPAGVVAVISPFNVPLILSIRSVAPALALGNAVILKPDPRTPVTGGMSIARVFEEAGLPAGVLQVLPGGADVGEALVVDPAVRVISFTGSTQAGRRVGELAGKHLKRAHLELGGNSAMVVLEDADVDEAVTLAAFGSYFHQGQICMTTGRHLVHEDLYDTFVEKLAAKAARLPVGDPATAQVALGPLIDAGQRDKIQQIVTDTVAAGARVAAGGKYEGLFYQATVLADVPPHSRAFSEEIFGPVAPVVKFSTDDEAVALTNGDYGLSLGIVTTNVLRGLALAERIPTGIVHINDQTVNDEANSPFGGVGASGNGARFGGATANIEAFTETRWITMREKPATYPY
ncbi:Vanillin dehydrogenase [Frankia sp. AiPs1]|uniref:benzaldehyde dehydrogenase n=1 Tax=Frankia sp. AiPa1 TaxID=573492 RepID=UPI00202B4A71|nr:benzaldehyde dehydrogenase [Frankia sp. AiPa1]MCL9763003.1 benzaldehyde dehydrogenase [Frankia sp. AiPa1]